MLHCKPIEMIELFFPLRFPWFTIVVDDECCHKGAVANVSTSYSACAADLRSPYKLYGARRMLSQIHATLRAVS